MSFNFGSNQSAFGSTPAKPTAFGAPLSFGTPATTASMGFGGFGSSFGQQQQQPTFGSTSFGQTAAPTFGQTSFGQATSTPGFGSTFGTPATSAPAFGTAFGTPASAAPAFGASAFGAAATPAAPFGSAASTAMPFGGATPAATPFGATQTAATPFGASFGATPASSAPAFGSTFGATPASSAPSLFGASAAKPSYFGQTSTAGSLFGTTTSQAQPLFGGATTAQPLSLFGTPAQPTALPAPATGAFAQTATSAAPSLFSSGFGANALQQQQQQQSTATTAPSLFGAGAAPTFNFGTSATPSAGGAAGGFGLFGATASTVAAPTQPTFTGFNTTASGGFGGGFTGFGPTTSTTSSLFGAGAFGAKPAIATTATVPTEYSSPIHQTLSSFYNIHLFGDERDAIIKKWNMLQACWGTGKGYYNAQKPPVDYSPGNPFYRFSSVGYMIIPGADNNSGLVKLTFSKKEPELLTQKEMLTNGILSILGNKPNLTVNIEYIKAIGENQTEMMISVSEKGVAGTVRQVLATDLAAFLNQPMAKQQLTNVGVTAVTAFVVPTKSQLQEYLDTPPPGIELQLWQMAQADNPNPNKFMPSAVNGFTDLKKRISSQHFETGLQHSYLEKVSEDIGELKKKNANSIARINELKQKYVQMYQKILKILIKQETNRRAGMALTNEEEMLRSQLHGIIKQMTVPLPLKNQITDIWSNLTLHGLPDKSNQERYKMEPDMQDNIKQFLKMEQNGINHLINIIRGDMKSLKTISDGLEKIQVN